MRGPLARLLPIPALLALAACAGIPAGSADRTTVEHPGFGFCAQTVQAAWPGEANRDVRARELSACLERGAALQVAAADRF
ncbi:hypothetical protein [Rhodocista pekingensis]|uniref:Uncharacterized protein n=1 Tax=Rhodocista pekingensis TaxID=201185 RepID=A0ABW2KSF0_9PROT